MKKNLSQGMRTRYEYKLAKHFLLFGEIENVCILKRKLGEQCLVLIWYGQLTTICKAHKGMQIKPIFCFCSLASHLH